jgi:hypothetical protein
MYGVPARCHVCSAALGADAAFCPSCGTARLVAAPGPSQPLFQPSMPAPPLGSAMPGLPPPGPGAYGATAAYASPSAYVPPPEYGPQGGAYGGPPLTSQQQQSPPSGPVITEVILGIFGIFGVGWLAAGKTTTGLILLVLSALWWAVSAVTAVHTVGVGCCGIVPLNALFIAISAAMLHSSLRRG